MPIGELAGYVASALVFATFYMKTMLRLRIIAIVSNVAFITYGLLQGLPPILILHLCLLPLNIIRLYEFRGLVARTRAAARGDVSFDSLLPFMTAVSRKSGEVLFRRGDASHEMFYVCEGRVHLPEIEKTIGAGETLGEIGLFSEDRTRTMSAICETDCELLRISGEKFLQLYNQNPRFGFYIVRVITSRLIENYDKLVAAMASRPTAGEQAQGNVTATDPLAKLGEKRPMPGDGAAARPAETPMASNDWRRSRTLRGIRTAAAFLVFLSLLAIAWRAGPYVHSVLVRDAAVTTWSNLATAPIDGTIRFVSRSLDSAIGADGLIAVVDNEHLSHADYDRARNAVTLKQSELRHLEAYRAELEALDTERGDIKSVYAEQFRNQLDTSIANLSAELDTAKAQLAVLQTIASRTTELARTGTVAQSDADEARLRVSALEVKLTSMEAALKAARTRRAAADHGIFLTGAGADPNWVFDWRIDLKVAKKSSRLDIENARAELADAKASMVAAEKDLQRRSRARVTVPSGSMVWSRQVASGSTVKAGQPVAEWIDCSVLLVDVPIHDVELALITKGMAANVLLDGETEPVTGTVLMTRGSASMLRRTDLVAIPEGRHEGSAEVVIDISKYRDSFASCPVSRAASVSFPAIGILDIAAAWLRL